MSECQAADSTLRQYLRERISALLASRKFIEALPGHLPADVGSQARLPDLMQKLRALAELG